MDYYYRVTLNDAFVEVLRCSEHLRVVGNSVDEVMKNAKDVKFYGLDDTSLEEVRVVSYSGIPTAKFAEIISSGEVEKAIADYRRKAQLSSETVELYRKSINSRLRGRASEESSFNQDERFCLIAFGENGFYLSGILSHDTYQKHPYLA
jgi:hypothetical protein